MMGRRSASARAGGHARPQASQEVDGADTFDDPAALEDDGEIDVGPPPHEPLRHDADDGADLSVEPELASDDARVTCELSPPEAVAEHGDVRRPRRSVRGDDRPSDERRHSHDLERVRGDVVAAQALRLAFARPEDVADRGGDHGFEDRAALRDLEELVGRIPGAETARARLPDLHARQPVDVPVRERVHDHAVDDAVDGGRRHDAEGEGRHGEGGQAGGAGQAAGAEAQVLTEGLEPGHGAGRAGYGFPALVNTRITVSSPPSQRARPSLSENAPLGPHHPAKATSQKTNRAPSTITRLPRVPGRGR